MADAEPWKTVKIPPTVQELVTGVQEPPNQYVIPEQNRTALAGSEMVNPIPIIDLSLLSDSADEVSKLRSILENWGLFLVSFSPQISLCSSFITRSLIDLPPGCWAWNGARFSW